MQSRIRDSQSRVKIKISDPAGNQICQNAEYGMEQTLNGRSGRETRQVKRKIDSYAKPVLYTPHQSLTFQEWPERDKVALLKALKKYGHYDLENLCRAVPGKSKENIKVVINTWWKSARTAMLASANGKKSIEDYRGGKKLGRPSSSKNAGISEKVPIDQWLYKLENSQAAGGYSQSKLLAKVFLYISKYESHPPLEDCNGIDFKSLYEFLFCMLNGYPGKDLNAETSAYLLNSLRDMAALIHERGMSQEITFLERTQRITGHAKVVRQYGGKKKKVVEHVVEPDSDEAKFRKLLEIPGFNPLNISAEVLKK